MIFQRAGVAFLSSIVIHSLLGAWLLFSAQMELGQNSRVTVEISGIETTVRGQSNSAAIAVHPQTTAQANTHLTSTDSTAPSSPGLSPSDSASASAPTPTGPSSQVLNTYLSLIRDKISHAIRPPRVHLLSSLKSTLRLTLSENGEVKNQEIEQSSGSAEFDRAILTALEKSRPFPPFTQEMSEIHEVTVKLPIEIRPQ
jgi:TonB family protein